MEDSGALKLSKNTWHYRSWTYWVDHSKSKRAKNIYLHKEFPDLHPEPYTTLCPYFWVVVLRSPLLRLDRKFVDAHPAAQITFVVSVWLLLLGAFIQYLPREDPWAHWWSGYLIGFLFTLAVAAGVAAMLGSLALGAFIKDKLYERKLSNPKPAQPNIFIEQVKAKKRRVCPLLKFED